MIDGMDAVEACYCFAGIVGIRPDGMTLKQLWRMATGRIKQRRFEMLEQSHLIWGMDQIDVESYLFFGDMTPTGKGGPIEMDDELAANVAKEVERIRRENPDLPQCRAN